MRHLAKKRLATLLGLALLAATAWFGWYWFRDPDLVWTAVNVNHGNQQADAHLLQLNRRVNLLIDTGHPDTAAALLAFLRQRNVSRLHTVIITHSHRDHYGGLLALLENGITVDSVYFNPAPPFLVQREPWGCAQHEIDRLLQALRDRRIPLTAMTAGTQWAFDNGIAMKVLYIYDGLRTPVGRTDINDTSAVILLTHRTLRFLFTGDLNQALGRYLTTRQDVTPLRADVLKAPHHGAESMPENAFFEAVAPRAMLVPAPSGLWFSDRCRRMRELAAGRPTYVNGLDGHITVKSDGLAFRIEPQWRRDLPAENSSVRQSGR